MASLPNDIALAGKYHFVLEEKSVKNFAPQKEQMCQNPQKTSA